MDKAKIRVCLRIQELLVRRLNLYTHTHAFAQLRSNYCWRHLFERGGVTGDHIAVNATPAVYIVQL